MKNKLISLILALCAVGLLGGAGIVTPPMVFVAPTILNGSITGATISGGSVAASSVTGTLPIANGGTGNASGVAVAVPVSGVTGLGTGVQTALAANVGSAGAPVVNGGALGTPSSGVMSNTTTATLAAGTNTTALASTAHVFAERTNTATLTNKTLTGALATAQAADGDVTLLLLDAKAAQRKVDLAANTKAFAQGIATTAATSGSNGIATADSAQLDMGTGNFSIYGTFVIPDASPAADVVLAQKTDGTNGWKLALLTTGILRLTINTTNYDSTVAMTNTNNRSHNIFASVVRESASVAGSVSFYTNRNLLGTVVAITAGAPVSIDNAVSMYFAGTSTTRSALVSYERGLLNFAPTAAEIADTINGLPESWKWGNQTAYYSSNFSAGVNGWNQYGGTLTGNIDGIGGQDDNLRFYADGSTGVHFSYPTVSTVGKIVKITGEIYIPSTNTNIKRVGFNGNNSANDGNMSAIVSTLDTWVSFVGYTRVTDVNGIIRFFTGTSVAWSYTGANSVTDDLFYIRNVSTTYVGAVAHYSTEGAQLAQSLDDSSNNLHAFYPAAGASLTLRQNESKYVHTTPITGDTTLISYVPAGWELVEQTLRNTTTNAVDVRLGTTAGGVDVYPLTALNISTTLGGYKTISCKQSFSPTAAQTLYLSSTSWNSASLELVSYFRRIA